MLKPIGKRVLIQPESTKQETSSGIIVQRSLSKVRKGLVLAVGQSEEVKEGDTVLFPSGIGVEHDDGLLVGVEELLAVVYE